MVLPRRALSPSQQWWPRTTLERWPEGVTTMNSRGQGFGRIVVGVDGSASSMAALRWAIRQAKLTGSSVVAVIAWHLPAGYGIARAGDGGVDFEGDAKQILADALNEVTGPSPTCSSAPQSWRGVPPRCWSGLPGADLLVVGSRGHGEFAGLQHCDRYL
jgi:nucleotide-binding universal stress UspA family protein